MSEGAAGAVSPRSGRPWWRGTGLVVLAGLLLAGCTTALEGTYGPPQTVAGATTPPAVDPTQARIGAEEHPRIVASYGGVYHDDKLEKTLARIVGRCVAASDDPSQSYRITILNSPSVNAFALPGGYLYVTRGLLALANDSSEVAAVISHEMGHVTANHAMQRQNKARAAVIVSRVVSDVLQDGEAGQLALASSQRTLAAFSQQQELEADAIGVRTIGKAGYDPFAAARFLDLMGRYAEYKQAGQVQDKRPDFLASHPATPQRVEFAIRAARQFGAPGIGEVDRNRYLEGIDGIVFGDDPSQGFVRGKTFLHPTLGIGFAVPDGFVLDNTSDAVLATGPDGTALRFDGANLPAGSSLATYIASGWVNGLDAASIKTFQVNGLEAASAKAQAKGWVFRIAVIRVGPSATYRFIFANESDTPGLQAAADATIQSFRQLTPQQIAALKPLRVRVITVAQGDTVESLAGRMRGVDRPLDLFRVLNDIKPGASLPAVGEKVKIIAE
ncbi:putative Zn-dependent protease [Kaistia hirudinis]|jgi:predicted Zn-dependent protease|uniref:Putative Zn-dependent protease n=1 Tax=Kaistia hirudinis TaxID=1293440 RepID=A0A840ASL3_9HYPH|nr:M48 family metalloprotease [Kaistia hirudinis]MBB3931455.1 putative Zn-dependent protease [Kaistia hirudinis]MBN9016091.1 M48 family metalloprotease [Hyphomicrobiales bacterium]